MLVGGFADSRWLYKKVHEELESLGFNVTRPDSYMSVIEPSFHHSTSLIPFARKKVVSEGAISFYLDHYVRTRVSKMTYGMFCNLIFDPHNPDHVKRDYKSLHAVSGAKLVPDAFYIILPKVRSIVSTVSDSPKLIFGLSRIRKYPRRQSSGVPFSEKRRIEAN